MEESTENAVEEPSSQTVSVTLGRPAALAIAFGIVLAIHAFFVFAFPYWVTVDGPAHIGASAALWETMGRDTVTDLFVTVKMLPATNAIPNLGLGPLTAALGYASAEKLTVIGFVVGLPLAMAYAITSVSTKRWWLSFLVVPLAFTHTLHYGFFAFSYGTLGFLFVVGYALRKSDRWTARSVALLSTLLTATYIAHVLPFALALMALGLIGLADVLRVREKRGTRLRSWLLAAIAAIPGAILFASFIVMGLSDERTSLVTDGLAGAGMPLIKRIVWIMSLAWGTVSLDRRAVIGIGLIAVCLGTILVFSLRDRLRRRRFQTVDGLFLFALVVFLGLLIAPSGADFGAGGNELGPRLALYPAFAALIWSAPSLPAARVDRWARAIIPPLAIAVSLGLMVVRFPAIKDMSSHAEAYGGVAQCVGENASMIQVNLGRVKAGSWKLSDPFTADTGRLSSIRSGWDVGNIESALPFFSLRNREATDPYLHLLRPGGSIEGIPPSIDPEHYTDVTGQQIDYILVYARALAEPGTLIDPGWVLLKDQLDRDYEVAVVSTDGLLEVHVHRQFEGAPSVESCQAVG